MFLLCGYVQLFIRQAGLSCVFESCLMAGAGCGIGLVCVCVCLHVVVFTGADIQRPASPHISSSQSQPTSQSPESLVYTRAGVTLAHREAAAAHPGHSVFGFKS
jgi:hypothetical protein